MHGVCQHGQVCRVALSAFLGTDVRNMSGYCRLYLHLCCVRTSLLDHALPGQLSVATHAKDAVDLVPYPTPSKSLLEQLLAACGNSLGTRSKSPAKLANSLLASCKNVSALPGVAIAIWAPLLQAMACSEMLLAQAFLKLLDSVSFSSQCPAS